MICIIKKFFGVEATSEMIKGDKSSGKADVTASYRWFRAQGGNTN